MNRNLATSTVILVELDTKVEPHSLHHVAVGLGEGLEGFPNSQVVSIRRSVAKD